MKRPEQALQITCVAWLEILRKQGRLTFFHVPNAGRRSPRMAAIMKAMGLRAGVPDLVLCFPRCRVVFVELKAPKPASSRLSPAQAEFHVELRGYGFGVFTISSLEELNQIINQMENANVQ